MNVPDVCQLASADAAILMARLDALGQCTQEPGRITRPYATPALARARDLVAGWMQAAGMSTRVDAVGNLIGRYAGKAGATQTLVTGSHIDSVRDAGRYDGPLGALVPISCVERLHRGGRRLPFSIEIVAFVDEEGLRFRSSFLGSSVYAGTFNDAELALVDSDGTSLADAIRGFGGDPDALAAAARDPNDLIGYIEVHIEQGPILDAAGEPLGIVTSIQGQSRGTFTLSGVAGHAGTVPMHLRRDALAGAAAIVLAIEAVARETDALVATVGQITVEPGAANVIPARATLTYDVRHSSDAVREGSLTDMQERAAVIAHDRGLILTYGAPTSMAAVPCDLALQDRLVEAVAALGLPTPRLASGAGHDAMSLAQITPVAILFVRCAGGTSHNPDESIRTDDAALAIGALSGFLERLATETPLAPRETAA